jgi:hypothetical protein
VIAGGVVTDIGEAPGGVVDVLAALVPGVDLFDQVAGAVVIVMGLFAHGPDLSYQPVVAVVLEPGGVILGVGQGDEVVAV